MKIPERMFERLKEIIRRGDTALSGRSLKARPFACETLSIFAGGNRHDVEPGFRPELGSGASRDLSRPAACVS